jgi:hypothetical protein
LVVGIDGERMLQAEACVLLFAACDQDLVKVWLCGGQLTTD